MMDEKTFADFLKKQSRLITPTIKEAIEEQVRLRSICDEKQRYFYKLEDHYCELFSQGVQLLFEQHPEVREMLPDEETKVGAIKAIIEKVFNPDRNYKTITELMKTIPQLVETDQMNVEIGKACFEYFEAFRSLTERINQDRKRLFSPEYLKRMEELADEGVIMFFLETPDYPLLEKECDADYVLDSFIFENYTGTRSLLYSIMAMQNVGDSMRRKQEDIYSAVNNMMKGNQRTAARDWFALLESEHKKCANVFEGFWEKERTFKNGFQRSQKIQDLLNRSIDTEWEEKAWAKIDSYYAKITSRETIDGVINRNAIVHGDYGRDEMDVSARDVVKLMLMWLNMRLIADYYCNLEEYYENKITIIPYLCSLFPES